MSAAKTGEALVKELRQFNHHEAAKLLERKLAEVERLRSEIDAFVLQLTAPGER